MGEVYKATDTRLNRTVAIKVLPPKWANDPTMKQRFDREAQTVASLKHPNICVLHDVGRLRAEGASADQGQSPEVDFLVMEYLEGETLTDRLKRGPLPLDEALSVAIAIADALDKAHRQGVVHRDLKPSNVMLTESGPKLLDFGLAKSRAALPAPSNVTLPGIILGTMQYMAPEQLDGVEADARTDIFAFGVVVQEMVTGKKTFEGKSQALLISAIATADPPPLSTVQPATPPAVDHIVQTCLAKDPADRWQDARDLLAELQWAAEGGESGFIATVGVEPRTRGRWRRAALVATAVLVAVLAVPAFFYLKGPREPDELRFRVARNRTAQPAEGGVADFSASGVAVSPNGRSIAFTARDSAQDPWVLYVRPVGGVTPQRLAGTDDASQPFWSPDSLSIAFVTSPGGKLRKVQASGGAPQDICDAKGFAGGTWNRDGTILFGSDKGLMRVPAQGGRAAAITTADASESGHFWPRFLPDGRHYLYLANSTRASGSTIFVGALDSQEKTRLMGAQSNAIYTDPGYLLFHRDNIVYAQAFSAKTLALSGEPVDVADEVSYNDESGLGYFDVSRDGVLIYYANSLGSGGASGQDAWEWQLRWTDPDANPLETVGPYGLYRGVELAPDGKRVAVHRHDGTGGDIWVLEPPPRSPKRITFDASHDNSSPVWSPDGMWIVFASQRNGKSGLYRTHSDGSGGEELLFESDLPKAPMSWPDDKRLVFWVQDPKTAGDLWLLPLDGDRKPVPLIASAANETHGQVSPDRKWIAYTSDRTGRKEVYVQPFPSGGGLYQISPDAGIGGDWPRWKREGKELFYHAIGGAVTGAYANGSAIRGSIYSVPFSATGSAFEPVSPREVIRVFALRFAHSGGDYHTYDVSPDGQRFLSFQRVAATGAATNQFGPEVLTQGLTVAMHWTAALKK
jgi:Tol biopolymer transport system component